MPEYSYGVVVEKYKAGYGIWILFSGTDSHLAALDSKVCGTDLRLGDIVQAASDEDGTRISSWWPYADSVWSDGCRVVIRTIVSYNREITIESGKWNEESTGGHVILSSHDIGYVAAPIHWYNRDFCDANECNRMAFAEFFPRQLTNALTEEVREYFWTIVEDRISIPANPAKSESQGSFLGAEQLRSVPALAVLRLKGYIVLWSYALGSEVAVLMEDNDLCIGEWRTVTVMPSSAHDREYHHCSWTVLKHGQVPPFSQPDVQIKDRQILMTLSLNRNEVKAEVALKVWHDFWGLTIDYGKEHVDWIEGEPTQFRGIVELIVSSEENNDDIFKATVKVIAPAPALRSSKSPIPVFENVEELKSALHKLDLRQESPSNEAESCQQLANKEWTKSAEYLPDEPTPASSDRMTTQTGWDPRGNNNNNSIDCWNEQAVDPIASTTDWKEVDTPTEDRYDAFGWGETRSEGGIKKRETKISSAKSNDDIPNWMRTASPTKDLPTRTVDSAARKSTIEANEQDWKIWGEKVDREKAKAQEEDREKQRTDLEKGGYGWTEKDEKAWNTSTPQGRSRGGRGGFRGGRGGGYQGGFSQARRPENNVGSFAGFGAGVKKNIDTGKGFAGFGAGVKQKESEGGKVWSEERGGYGVISQAPHPPARSGFDSANIVAPVPIRAFDDKQADRKWRAELKKQGWEWPPEAEQRIIPDGEDGWGMQTPCRRAPVVAPAMPVEKLMNRRTIVRDAMKCKRRQCLITKVRFDVEWKEADRIQLFVLDGTPAYVVHRCEKNSYLKDRVDYTTVGNVVECHIGRHTEGYYVNDEYWTYVTKVKIPMRESIFEDGKVKTLELIVNATCLSPEAQDRHNDRHRDREKGFVMLYDEILHNIAYYGKAIDANEYEDYTFQLVVVPEEVLEQHAFWKATDVLMRVQKEVLADSFGTVPMAPTMDERKNWPPMKPRPKVDVELKSSPSLYNLYSEFNKPWIVTVPRETRLEELFQLYDKLMENEKLMETLFVRTGTDYKKKFRSAVEVARTSLPHQKSMKRELQVNADFLISIVENAYSEEIFKDAGEKRLWKQLIKTCDSIKAFRSTVNNRY